MSETTRKQLLETIDILIRQLMKMEALLQEGGK